MRALPYTICRRVKAFYWVFYLILEAKGCMNTVEVAVT